MTVLKIFYFLILSIAGWNDTNQIYITFETIVCSYYYKHLIIKYLNIMMYTRSYYNLGRVYMYPSGST